MQAKLADGAIVDAIMAPLWWQSKNLQQTASGYGRRLTTPYKVEVNGKWRRVYCCCYSNNGTLYIGNLSGKSVIVNDIYQR